MRATLHRYLLERPAGATARELLDLVFTQPGADAEFGVHFIRAMLDGDPRFRFRAADQHWVASVHAALARPLAETEFVVVDLETTGGSPQRGNAIIEIGAVRIDRARRTQRFTRLVDPGHPLPPFITRLTGITDDLLAGQPRVADVLPEFLEFVGDRVLVAHNARFDLGFLNAAAQAHLGHPLPQPHLCTMRLARRLVAPLRRRGLDAVAAHFGIALVDRHRALGDAVITAEIFLHFLELLAARGVARLDQALALQASARDGRLFACPLPRAAIDALPDGPGVYRFYGEDGRVLYIGKAKRLRQRVSHYLTNSDGHSRKTLDLIRHIHDVRGSEAGSELEAALIEAEAIRAEQPPYNQLGKHLPRIAFLKLTNDAAFPRLLVTSRLSARGGRCFGPFRSRESAVRVMGLVTRLFRLRTCAGRLRPDASATACVQGQIAACTAPCTARVTATAYAEQVAAFLRLLAGDAEALAEARARLTAQRAAHAAALRFEAAARVQQDLEQLERLMRRQKSLGWIVAQHHFLIVQPSVRGDAVLGYLVIGGRLVERRQLGSAGDLRELAMMSAQHQLAGGRHVPLRAQDVDGTTILAAWLRDRGERDGFVFKIADAGAAAQQLPEWEVALASLLAQTTARPAGDADEVAAPSQPQRDRHAQHRHLAEE